MFRNVVLTIDRRRKKITTSIPYRPSYMKLDYRTDIEVLPGSAVVCRLRLTGLCILCCLIRGMTDDFHDSGRFCPD